MTDSQRWLTVLLAVLAVSTLAAPAAAAAGGDSRPLDAREARLAIEQPAYVDGDVSQRSIDGVRTYTASGERLRVQPTNFDPADVVDYGVEEDEATLTYDEQFGVFNFEPAAEGTYHVYFVTREQYAAGNTTAANTTNSTETVRVRYEAAIRMEGSLNTVHISQEERDQLERHAELGATVNATLEDIRERSLPFVDNSGSDREIFRDMAGVYVNWGYPGSFFTGSLQQIMLLLVMSLGGLFLIAVTFIGFGRVYHKAKKKLNIFEVTEAEEGALAERQAEIDDKERQQAFQNMDWSDIFPNPTVADAFRDSMGETPKDGFDKLLRTELAPEVWIRDRLQAMGMDGWHARVERTPTSADSDSDGRIESAELLDPGTDLDDVDGDVIAVDDELDQLVDVLDWECDELREFDLTNADIDWNAMDTKPVTLDAPTLVEELDLQYDRFGNDEVAAQYLDEFITTVREHEFTDSDGDPETVREHLNDLLRACQYYGDVAELPGAEVARQHVQRALSDHDENEQARQYAEEVRAGVS